MESHIDRDVLASETAHNQRLELLEFEKDRHERELVHAERIKALEMGFDPSHSRWPLAMVCSMIGFGVPFFATLAIAKASEIPGVSGGIWLVDVCVSVPAIIVAGILGYRGLVVDPASKRTVDPHAKPELDAEAYDFAGSRG